MIIKNPDKKLFTLSFNKKLGLILIVLSLILLIVNYSLNEFPVFSNKKAKSYFLEHYPNLLIRYAEVGEREFLPIIQLAALDALAVNSKKILFGESLPHININIDFESWQAIKDERNSMLESIFMAAEKEKYKASIQYRGKIIPIKLRLKGERTDHVKEERRWSFRIKTRKDKSIFGMEKFSIQHPSTRDFQREAVFLDFAKVLNILSLRYFFINVSINGEDIGIMALEEFPSKEQLENNSRKEGHVFKLDDKNVPLLYHSVANSLGIVDEKVKIQDIYVGHYERLSRIYYNALNAEFKSLTKSKTIAMSYQEEIATALMKGVMEGKLLPSEAFDVNKMGKFFAYLVFLGDSHSASFRNSRYYFNPYTLKFEPIFYDSNARSARSVKVYPNNSTMRDHELSRILIQDPRILESYIEELNIFKEFADSPSFIKTMKELENPYLSDLREEFWLLPNMNFSSHRESVDTMLQQLKTKEFFKKEYEYINSKNDPDPLILPPNYVAPDVLHVNAIEEDGKVYLEIHNLFPLNTRITSLNINISGKNVPTASVLSIQLPFTVAPFFYHEYLRHERIELINITSNKDLVVTGKVKIETQENREYEFTVGQSVAAIDEHPLKSMDVNAITKANSFIHYIPDSNSFYIPEGVWKISKTIIFPNDASLTISPKTKLLFTKGVGLYLKGPLHANGSEGKEIIFDSLDGTIDNAWAGIAVMESKSRSLLNYVVIKNTDFTKYKGWELTGAVTFYHSDVDITNTTFENSIAEDALNIVGSRFTFKNSHIIGSRSDGFDGDFVEGSISQSNFSKIGGDAVDFSGSTIYLEDSSFDDIYDKAISVGEASSVIASNLYILNSGTGMAVKDGSNAKIKKSIFSDIHYASLMAYTKKSVYGVSELVAEDVKYLDVKNALVAQGKNKMRVNGVIVEAKKVDIDKLYDEGYMKK